MRFQSLLACLATAPMLVAAAEPVRLQPASKWVLDYGENSCRLLRTFGDPATPTLLLFERLSPSSALSMVVIGKALDTPPGKDLATARFLGVEGLAFKEGQTATSASGKDPAVLWSSVGFTPMLEGDKLTPEMKLQMEALTRGKRPERLDLAKRASFRAEALGNAAKVNQVEIVARRKKPLVLETGSLGKAITMLDECSRHQLKGWGIDPDVEDKIVRPAWAPKPYTWFSSDDYPIDSIRKGERSVVEARLLIDAEGKVNACTALSHVDAPAFQKVVCDTLKRRGKYQPAELADGTKVPSYTTYKVRFELPR